ncbi:MAG: HhH-GPD family protein, DNA-3-methyladenine glycosylase II [Microgenomates group bacterium GW2011_GWC1_41_20]|uniref:DNA-3-methyladenine glycosylase II n=6 Tax=Candidatus Woeseibacteriota TaxID=1752722 RepID=A0A0G0RUN5_9BACT|nr:MAG: HhH-GPD family protein [Candidatus Woesebacteria bacterium GW2011_GWB1_40_12]KKR56283.1 MAG: HhH-GPD family protein [Candidatus Woesebacteria bacterium GW2011_GWF1_40_24]KKR91057.1 MAG: HhH-GPD family protein [Candidatus Woesebacteria bacterium GW2011_GWD1_41_12]KKS00713.1 MAG: HhH-GPD family protein, DNA-3-methyladenine glycosylase II [Microgenomates group bacterium GW2011_GWC1_41_20]KKS05675.1 MAG: HhH-GPD family protein [Candidatus Woesebacteria bacterium GW2011_GWE1_41_24]OGM81754.
MWEEAEKFLLKDKYLSPLVKKCGSCTIKKSMKFRYFVDLLESIANQQLSGKAASTIFGRVRDLCDGDINPEIILKLSEEKLRKAGLSFAKIRYIKDLASRTKSGELDLKKLYKLTDEEVIGKLIVVKGIGRWTAEMFLMFSLARPDIFPVDDLGVKKGFEKVTGKMFDKEKSFKFALKNWAPYRTVASWYLWRSLEN